MAKVSSGKTVRKSVGNSGVRKSARRAEQVNLSNTYGIKATKPNTNSAVTQGKPANKLSKAKAKRKVRG